MIAPFNRTVLSDGDYTLSEGKAWVEVAGFAVRIQKTDEGIAVDVYRNGREMDDSLAYCYAFDSDLDDEICTKDALLQGEPCNCGCCVDEDPCDCDACVQDRAEVAECDEEK